MSKGIFAPFVVLCKCVMQIAQIRFLTTKRFHEKKTLNIIPKNSYCPGRNLKFCSCYTSKYCYRCLLKCYKLFSGYLFLDFIGYKSSLTLRDSAKRNWPKQSICLVDRSGEANGKYLFLLNEN